MDNKLEKQQNVFIFNRKKLEIDGAINVLNLSSDYLEISTLLGDISIDGKALKIEELNQSCGKIFITGEIDGVFYKSNKTLKNILFKKQK